MRDDVTSINNRAAINHSSSSSSNDKITNDNNKSILSEALSLPKAKDKANLVEEAKDKHDIFNLIALPIVVGFLIRKFKWNLFYVGVTQCNRVPASFIDDEYLHAFCAFLGYLILDLIWVITDPVCVKSPGTIIKHHIFCIIYVWAPMKLWAFGGFMGPIVSVEINTIFLILRRVLYRRNTLNNRIVIPPIVTIITDFLFYSTWIGIRLIVFNLILVTYFSCCIEIVKETGTLFNVEFGFIAIHLFLCVLNGIWSYRLFHPIIKRAMTKGGNKTAAAAPGFV